MQPQNLQTPLGTSLVLPEDNGIASRVSSTDLCPNGFPAVFNEATASGLIGGPGVVFESIAISIGPNLTCHDYKIYEGCDNSMTIQGSLTMNSACCSPPPPPPPPPPCDVQPTNCSSGCSWDPDLCRCTCSSSPIIIDTSGQGFNLTDALHGVKFDLRGTGQPIQIAWTAPGANNAFLALPGADGLVHNGKQLFGNFTPQPPSATPNGFAALAVYDDPKNGGNGDGVIDARDAVFASLRLWIDANHDGISQPEELHTLPSLGVNSISLSYKADQRTDQWGNVFHYRAQVNPGDATSTGRMAYDVFFVTLTNITKNMLNPAGRKCQVPTKKVGMLAPVSSSLR